MEGEEAEKSERRRGDKATNLWSIDGIEVEILDFGSDERAFPQGLVQTTLDKAGMDAGEVDKVEIETGLGSGGDNEQGNKGKRHRTVPKKAGDHQHEKEVEAVEELLVVGVLHLPHPSKLFHPKSYLFFCLRHQGIMPSQKEKNNLVTFPDESFGRRYLHGAIKKFP